MKILTFLSILTFSIGIQTSVSIPAGMHILGFLPAAYFIFKSRASQLDISQSFMFLFSFILIWFTSGLTHLPQIIDPKDAFGDLKYWIFGLIFPFALVNFFSTDQTKKIRLLINTLLLTIIVAAIVGIIRVKFGFDPVKFKYKEFHERAGGFYGYMRYAYNLQYLIVAMTSFIIYRKSLKQYFSTSLLYVAYAFGWMGLLFSQTRGALLATLLGTIVVLFFKNKRLGLKIFAASLVLGAISLGIVFTGGSEKIRILEKHNSSSNTVRLSQFSAAFEAFKENPLLGLGPGQFRHQVRDIKIRHNLPHQEYYGQHAHNIYLEMLANLGILGLLGFLLWIFSWFWEEWKTNDLWSRGFSIPLILTCLSSGLVEYVFNSTGSFTVFFIYSLSLTRRFLKQAP